MVLLPEVSLRELIELRPPLWDIIPPLLDNSMEPRKGKQGLGPGWIVATFYKFWGPSLVGSVQVLFDARWRFVCHLGEEGVWTMNFSTVVFLN